MKAFAADGVTVQQFNEPAGGQVVFHLHFHVIPRFDGVALQAAYRADGEAGDPRGERREDQGGAGLNSRVEAQSPKNASATHDPEQAPCVPEEIGGKAGRRRGIRSASASLRPGPPESRRDCR